MNPHIFTEAVKAAFIGKLFLSIALVASVVISALLLLAGAIRGSYANRR